MHDCGPHMWPARPDMWPGRPGHVARTCGPDSPDMRPAQPGHVARRQESGLSGLGPVDLARVEELCAVLPRPPAPDISFSLDVLRRAVTKVGRTASGLDQWAAAAWSLLPDQFLFCLRALWQRCLAIGRLPHVWRHVRIALLTKPDGGTRPIAIAVCAYRACATATAVALRPWVASFVPDALHGGVPGRSAASLHDQFFDHLAAAHGHDNLLCGAKVDIRQCFDRMDFEVTFRVCSRLGAPPGLVSVLRRFYAFQCRWFTNAGVVHPVPVQPERGLLQGCPFSPLLLNCTMTLWCLQLRAMAPSVHLGVYLDDRTLWSVGDRSPDALVAATEAAADVDRAAGMEPHTLACFALHPELRRKLHAHTARLGPMTNRPTLLGVTYTFGGRTVCAPAAEITAKVKHRCRKIAKAATSLRLRRRLLESLVMSFFRWTGPWHRYEQAAMDKWVSQFEFALCGRQPPPGRSALLLWLALGKPGLHPAFALHYEALRHEWRRQGAARRTHLPGPQFSSCAGLLCLDCFPGRLDYAFWSSQALLGFGNCVAEV